MKKALIVIVIILCSVSLYSAEPVVKLYLQDGSSKQYKISEIGNLTFINSNLSYKMLVYKKGSYEESDTRYLDSVLISPPYLLEVYRDKYAMTKLWEIDSIIFVWNTCEEIQIGSQIWMCKNLDVDHYRNGDSIPEVRDTAVWSKLTTGAWCYFNNDPAMGKIYGKLYNWYAVDDRRGLAPDGWHVPSDSDWKELEMYLGMSKSEADNTYFRGTNEGGKLKSTGTIDTGNGLWLTPNFEATNCSGFTGLPGGMYYLESKTYNFYNLNIYGYWWSSTEYSLSTAFIRSLAWDRSGIGRYNDKSKGTGLSVRCLKGGGTQHAPMIDSISPAKALIADTVVLYGYYFLNQKDTNKVTFAGAGADAVEYISWSNSQIKLKVPSGAKIGKVFVTVNGVRGNDVDFTVITPCSSRSTYSSDSIGTQVWMGENLDVCTYKNGDPIPEVTDPAEWFKITTGAWCYYNNDPDLGKIYGKLYNWYAVNDPRGLAPDEWHIPTDSEWAVFTANLGGFFSGGKLKSTGTIEDSSGLWKSPNIGATNETGFSALPGGNRSYNGTFSSIGTKAYWWTSTKFYMGNNAWSIFLSNNENSINSRDYFANGGFSVRCLKD